jgi:hypothetical protein
MLKSIFSNVAGDTQMKNIGTILDWHIIPLRDRNCRQTRFYAEIDFLKRACRYAALIRKWKILVQSWIGTLFLCVTIIAGRPVFMLKSIFSNVPADTPPVFTNENILDSPNWP